MSVCNPELTTRAREVLAQAGVDDAVRGWLLPDECGLMNEGEHDDDLSLLAELGLVDAETFDDTDLGRECARQLSQAAAALAAMSPSDAHVATIALNAAASYMARTGEDVAPMPSGAVEILVRAGLAQRELVRDSKQRVGPGLRLTEIGVEAARQVRKARATT